MSTPTSRGFDVRLNPFGEVDMTLPIDELNDFLDREVDDPKLKQWGVGGGVGRARRNGHRAA